MEVEPRLAQQAWIVIGTEDCSVLAQMAAAVLKAVLAASGKAMHACPHKSLPPAAIKVIEKDAPGPFPSAETAGPGTFNPCMAGLVSTNITSGATPL
jgi:hypothetical protein